MSNFAFNSFFILVQYIILKFNVSSHPLVYETDTIFWSSTPTNFSYEPPLEWLFIVKRDVETIMNEYLARS
jgi:hypothetical protein